MLKTIANRHSKRAAARRRAIRRRAAIWKQRARRALTLMMVAGGMLGGSAGVAHAQMGGLGGMGAAGGFGQAAMAPTGGLVNRAVTRLQNLEANGPGWLYYGLNAADRGLGYNGSYMTLGGFIPYAEDDLGGLWSADLRSHLSEYGGFFSNVGAVRKQFIGGTILGIGVYWDYDGDQNQYQLRGIDCGTGVLGQFGHSYNQVGVSGEWLTDYGNIRSNGYIPVGTTAYTAGAPGTRFYQNFVMCQYGLDAALAGADLEVGAYIPGLSDWAGMISVGGYALGNARYDWSLGPQVGRDVVPFFGGVYTRLDMTFIKNWDFSLQANNDSYFDWTGFARLTYRMGGSRRRNVPDQMEQPMMRNEHIVRAHQTPIVATNETTGDPWRVIHVNNAAPTSGNGTAESPFTTIAAANAAATNPYDVVFVSRGNGVYNQTTPFAPLAAQQFLIGDGGGFCLASCCGPIDLTAGGLRPIISNPSGPSVLLDGGLTTANFIVQGSRVGVQAGPGLLVGDTATVTNYDILGSNVPGQPQTGIALVNTGGNVVVANTLVRNMTDVGIRVDGVDPAGGVAPNLSFQGSLTNNASTGGGTAPIIEVKNTLGGGGGNISIAAGPTPAAYTQGACPDLLPTTAPNLVTDIGGGGIVVQNSDSNVTVDNVTLANSVGTAVSVLGSGGSVKIGTNGPATITNPANGAILVQGGSTDFRYNGSITNNAGHAVKVDGTTGGSVVVTNPSGRSTENGKGILVQNSAGDVLVEKFDIKSSQEGVLVQNNTFTGAKGGTFKDIKVTEAKTAGISSVGNTGPVNYENIEVTLTGSNSAIGFNGVNNTAINMAGSNSVSVNGNAALSMTNGAAVVDNNKLLFTALSSTNSVGNGVFLSGVDGKLDVTGAGINVTAPTLTGVLIQNTQTGLDVSVPGTVTVSGAQSNGISLLNVNDGSGVNTVFFNSIAVDTKAGAGLTVTNASVPASGNGLVGINGGTIKAAGGPAIDATNANLAVTLATVSSTASATNGISLVGCDNSLGTYPALVIGKTTIANAATNGIFLQDNVPLVPGSGSFADFGVLNISASGQNGIFAQNTAASFDAATISTSGNNAVQLVADFGEITTFQIQNSILNGAGAAGVSISANNGGVVNATVLNNQIKATGNSLTGVTTGAGADMEINFANNAGVGVPTPVGQVTLTNAAGNTLGVSQSAGVLPAPPGPYTALQDAIKASNNGVTVTITNPVGGVVNQGVTVPTP